MTCGLRLLPSKPFLHYFFLISKKYKLQMYTIYFLVVWRCFCPTQSANSQSDPNGHKLQPKFGEPTIIAWKLKKLLKLINLKTKIQSFWLSLFLVAQNMFEKLFNECRMQLHRAKNSLIIPRFDDKFVNKVFKWFEVMEVPGENFLLVETPGRNVMNAQ